MADNCAELGKVWSNVFFFFWNQYTQPALYRLEMWGFFLLVRNPDCLRLGKIVDQYCFLYKSS